MSVEDSAGNKLAQPTALTEKGTIVNGVGATQSAQHAAIAKPFEFASLPI